MINIFLGKFTFRGQRGRLFMYFIIHKKRGHVGKNQKIMTILILKK